MKGSERRTWEADWSPPCTRCHPALTPHQLGDRDPGKAAPFLPPAFTTGNVQLIMFFQQANFGDGDSYISKLQVWGCWFLYFQFVLIFPATRNSPEGPEFRSLFRGREKQKSSTIQKSLRNKNRESAEREDNWPCTPQLPRVPVCTSTHLLDNQVSDQSTCWPRGYSETPAPGTWAQGCSGWNWQRPPKPRAPISEPACPPGPGPRTKLYHSQGKCDELHRAALEGRDTQPGKHSNG